MNVYFLDEEIDILRGDIVFSVRVGRWLILELNFIFIFLILFGGLFGGSW